MSPALRGKTVGGLITITTATTADLPVTGLPVTTLTTTELTTTALTVTRLTASSASSRGPVGRLIAIAAATTTGLSLSRLAVSRGSICEALGRLIAIAIATTTVLFSVGQSIADLPRVVPESQCGVGETRTVFRPKRTDGNSNDQGDHETDRKLTVHCDSPSWLQAAVCRPKPLS
jgi:hypothetical protein